MNQRQRDKELRDRIALICDAVDHAEPSRLLARWRKDGPDEAALEAMRCAIKKVDGSVDHTTDALAAAFEAGLRAFTRPKRAAPARAPDTKARK
jgi:hypothetical protein